MQQLTLARQAEFQRYTKKTRRKQFLKEMEAEMPWAKLKALVAPHYSKGETGRHSDLPLIRIGRRNSTLLSGSAFQAPQESPPDPQLELRQHDFALFDGDGGDCGALPSVQNKDAPSVGHGAPSIGTISSDHRPRTHTHLAMLRFFGDSPKIFLDTR